MHLLVRSFDLDPIRKFVGQLCMRYAIFPEQKMGSGGHFILPGN